MINTVVLSYGYSLSGARFPLTILRRMGRYAQTAFSAVVALICASLASDRMKCASSQGFEIPVQSTTKRVQRKRCRRKTIVLTLETEKRNKRLSRVMTCEDWSPECRRYISVLDFKWKSRTVLELTIYDCCVI